MGKRINLLSEIAGRPAAVIAVGIFDGVHLGHQQLLQQVVAAAREANAVPMALTFYPHPREVITGDKGRYYLMRLEERVAHIMEQGIELVITHPFDAALRQTRAKDFVAELQTYTDLKQLWGGSFSLGYQGEGDYTLLSQLGAERGFAVHLVQDLVESQGAAVSSSRIRHGLESADMQDVTACLGRPYQISGEVVMGRQLGRTIGVPTANVAVWEKQRLPANGVYAAWVTIEGESERYMAATNIGVRPTVDESAQLTIEPHLLDFDRDIYGKQVQVAFVDYLRPEKKFDGLDALKAGISADIQQVRARLTD